MAVIKAVVLFAFSNYNIITFRCPRSYACGRSNFIFVLLHQSPWMSLVYITYRYVLICLMFEEKSDVYCLFHRRNFAKIYTGL